MKTLTTLVAALAAAQLLALPAAAEASGPQSIAIRHIDLDLSTERGVRMLDRRIHNAAVAFCGTASPADPRSRAEVADCRAGFTQAAAARRDQAVAEARGVRRTRYAAER
jgi:UrcA family protein